MKKQKKLDSTQRAMVLVTTLGVGVGFLIGGYFGHFVGNTNGFLDGVKSTNKSWHEFFKSGAVKLVDTASGEIISANDMAKWRMF